jgi:ribulose-5-phosphate 4-epimerase/fuculose-1-phosphate aldolase
LSCKIRERFAREIEELADSARRLAALGYVSSHGGNLSYRVAPDIVLITPTKVPKERVAAEDICAVDMEGRTVLSGEGRKPTGEAPMHLFIMRRRPDVNALLHAHPPVLTGFACSSKAALLAKPILPEPSIELGPVALVDYAEPLTDDLARAFEPHLAGHDAFLMRNHGMMVLSREGIARALDFTIMLEKAATSALVAELLGGVTALTRGDVADLDRTLRTRGLPLPGAPGAAECLASLFFPPGQAASGPPDRAI